MKIPPIPDEWARRIELLKAVKSLRAERTKLREQLRTAREAFRSVAEQYVGRPVSPVELCQIEGMYEQISAEVENWNRERRPALLAALQAQVAEQRARETPFQRALREAKDPKKEAAAAAEEKAHHEAMEKMRAWIILNTPRRSE